MVTIYSCQLKQWLFKAFFVIKYCKCYTIVTHVPRTIFRKTQLQEVTYCRCFIFLFQKTLNPIACSFLSIQDYADASLLRNHLELLKRVLRSSVYGTDEEIQLTERWWVMHKDAQFNLGKFGIWVRCGLLRKTTNKNR